MLTSPKKLKNLAYSIRNRRNRK